MENDLIKNWLEQVKLEDRQARENLLEHHRALIKKEAQRVCRRYLEWGHDDELSIALIAFNESIDAYSAEQCNSFWPFARMVIKRRLIDYFRLSGTQALLAGEEALSKAAVDEDFDQAEREEEVKKYGQLLGRFKISFKQVAEAQPSHKETRERLRDVAVVLAHNKKMMDMLYASGKLPKKKLCEVAKVTPRMLDRGRAYVIALALLLSNEDLPLLQEYAVELTGKGEKSK